MITAAVDHGPWIVEGSLFNGREPDEDRWGFDFGALDSWSARLTVNPSDTVSAQASFGRLASPEFEEELNKRLGDTHLMNGVIGLRPYVFLELWVRIHPEWEDYLKAKKATEKPDTEN